VLGAAGEADTMAAYSNMGICFMSLGEPGRALKAFEEAEAAGRRTGPGAIGQLRPIAAGNAGIVYMNMGEPDLALDCFRRALKGYRETGNARGMADQLLNIGLARKHRGDYRAAADHFRSALGYAFTAGYVEGVLYAHRQVREALALQGRHGEEAAVDREAIRRHPGIAGLLGRDLSRRGQ
jgi:tetratricopeptide (TPR) repeat protein